MASPLLVNLDELDLTKVEFPMEVVRQYLPQRYEFEQLSGVIALLREQQMVVGFRDVRADEFWVRGHIPGRPLFPGVLMLEAAAQLSTFGYKMMLDDDPNRFLGFGGLDKCKFRGTVGPGDRLILIAKTVEARTRRMVYDTQGVVNGKLVFEAQIIGLPV